LKNIQFALPAMVRKKFGGRYAHVGGHDNLVDTDAKTDGSISNVLAVTGMGS
jgi:hypothetical protein